MARATDRTGRRRRALARAASTPEPTAAERSQLRVADRERQERRAAEREAVEQTAARRRGRRRAEDRSSTAEEDRSSSQELSGREETATSNGTAKTSRRKATAESTAHRDSQPAASAATESAVPAKPRSRNLKPGQRGDSFAGRPEGEGALERRKETSPVAGPAAVPVVELRDVSKVYDGGVVGLQHASLKIGRGEFVFLVGPTGCGKSTCVRLLLHEFEPSAGEILISGHDLAEMPSRKVPHLRRNIGTIFQDFKLLPNRTVYANVAYSLEVIGESRSSIRRKVPDILRLVGLSTKLNAYPDELSGGEQQRVSIARAFVNHPPLLLADEPTGNLDPETSIGIMQLIYRINRTGTTVIVATHDHDMVDKMRRRVVELRDGRVIRDQASGLYRPDDESTTEFAVRLRGELGVGVEGHPN